MQGFRPRHCNRCLAVRLIPEAASEAFRALTSAVRRGAAGHRRKRPDYRPSEPPMGPGVAEPPVQPTTRGKLRHSVARVAPHRACSRSLYPSSLHPCGPCLPGSLSLSLSHSLARALLGRHPNSRAKARGVCHPYFLPKYLSRRRGAALHDERRFTFPRSVDIAPRPAPGRGKGGRARRAGLGSPLYPAAAPHSAT